MTTFPRYQEWLLLTATIQNRRADSVMKYLDSLIQRLERSHVSPYNYYLTVCDVFFTTDYWLKANRGYSSAHSAVEDLYRRVVDRLCRIFNYTVNVLPRELEFMFGRSMTIQGFRTDIIQGRSRDSTREELGKYRAVFKQGKVWQFPHWEENPTELLKLVNSAQMYNTQAGVRHAQDDAYSYRYAYFVMTMGRDLFLRKHSIGGEQKHNGIYHSNYTGGGAVLCAGSMFIEDGVVKVVRSDSGHYKPKDENVVSLLLALQMHGINIRDITVVNFDGTKVSPAPRFINENGNWDKFVTDHKEAADNDVATYRQLQKELHLQQPTSKVVHGIPIASPSSHASVQSRVHLGTRPTLAPNVAKPPPLPPRPGQRQPPPRPPRPGQRAPQSQPNIPRAIHEDKYL